MTLSGSQPPRPRAHPHRRASDNHNHPEYWTETEHYRFEDRVAGEIRELRVDVEKLSSRLTWIMGGLSLLTFLITILAPFLRSWIGVPP